jgi:hypothetical protein
VEVEEDHVMFDLSSLASEEIIKEGNYKGVRLTVQAKMGNVSHKLQVDVGFGDIATGGPPRKFSIPHSWVWRHPG